MRKLAVLLFPLLLFISGCPSSEKSMLTVAKDAAQTNLSFERGVTTVHKDNPEYCDDNCERTLLVASRKIAQLDDAAVNAIVKTHDAAGAIAKIDEAIAAVDDANTNGLLAVKNEGRKNALSAILLSLRGALVTAKAFLAPQVQVTP